MRKRHFSHVKPEELKRKIVRNENADKQIENARRQEKNHSSEQPQQRCSRHRESLTFSPRRTRKYHETLTNENSGAHRGSSKMVPLKRHVYGTRDCRVEVKASDFRYKICVQKRGLKGNDFEGFSKENLERIQEIQERFLKTDPAIREKFGLACPLIVVPYLKAVLKDQKQKPLFQIAAKNEKEMLFLQTSERSEENSFSQTMTGGEKETSFSHSSRNSQLQKTARKDSDDLTGMDENGFYEIDRILLRRRIKVGYFNFMFTSFSCSRLLKNKPYFSWHGIYRFFKIEYLFIYIQLNVRYSSLKNAYGILSAS